MASKTELEERIEQLQKQFNIYQEKLHSLENEVFQKDQEESEKPVYNVANQGKEMWINMDELNHALQQGKIDKATYNRIITHSKRKNPDYFKVEPNYLQVGDQWRDEEGNEYVLSKFPILGEYYATLVNKETGDTMNYGVKIHDKMNNVLKPSDYNGFDPSNTLGITENMIKIK